MEWQPIETAPKDGTKILICGGTYGCEFSPFEFYNAQNNDDPLIVIWCCNRKEFCEGDFHYHPTHWMPLPPPPKY
jgi:hypothetical protein